MPRLTKAERDLRDARAERDTAVAGRIAWMNRCEDAEKQVTVEKELNQRWQKSEIESNREIMRLRDEIGSQKVRINELHAMIGRLCIAKGMVV